MTTNSSTGKFFPDLSESSFLLLRKPGMDAVSVYVLTAGLHGSIVLAPFNGDAQVFEASIEANIPLKEFERAFVLPEPRLENDEMSTEKDEYLKKITQAVSVLQSGEIHKVVLSRKLVVTHEYTPKALFVRLAKTYPTACVFAFYTTSIGFWMGATPETLLKIEDGTVEAMSLAGTRPVNTESNWGTKELQEQQYVTDGICKTFETFNVTNVSVTKPVTNVAGPVEHLLTTVKGDWKPDANILAMAKALHPTPAVGGLPKLKATQYIIANDGYNRQFYTGYLGVFGDDHAHLWVNLRSMQLFKNGLVLYAGGGITADSNPQAEWEETERKLQTLMAVIKE